MERADLEALVAQLELEASSNPAGYKARVIGLAALGHAYLWGLLLFCFVAPLAALALLVRFH